MTAPRGRHPLGGAHIGIAGLIGAGKSTLAVALGARLGLEVHPGPSIDDATRDALIREPKHQGFVMQIDLLTQQVAQQRAIVARGRGGVQDRTLLEDAVYGRTLHDVRVFGPREHDVYFSLFESLSRETAPLDLLVYLDVSPEVAKTRVMARKRGRQVEVSLDFLRALHSGYEPLLQEVGRTVPVIRVPYNAFWDADAFTAALCGAYATVPGVRTLSRESVSGPVTG